MSRGPRPIRSVLVVAFLVLLLLAVTYQFWLAALGGFLVTSDAPASADCIVVLAGDFSGNRIMTAADLVRKGLASQAIISGPSEVYGLYESDLAIRFAVHHGYPESYFVALRNDARSTAAEAEVVIGELRRRHAHRVDLVTSNYHTRRALSIYRSKARDLEFHVVSAPDPYFTPGSWWKSRDGRKTFVIEWMKTVATWLGM